MRRTTATLILLALSACRSEGTTGTEHEGLEVPRAQLSSAEAREQGRQIFLERCALCHGKDADGHGRRRKGLSSPPPSFRQDQWRESVTPEHVFAIVSEGKQGTSMPGFPSLTKEQKWDVVAYVLSVAEHGP